LQPTGRGLAKCGLELSENSILNRTKQKLWLLVNLIKKQKQTAFADKIDEKSNFALNPAFCQTDVLVAQL